MKKAPGKLLLAVFALVVLMGLASFMACAGGQKTTSSAASSTSGSSLVTASTTTTESQGQGLLPNPFPTPESGTVAGSAERPSPWAESLGAAILKLYPDKNWKVLRAVEVAGGGATTLWIGSPQPGIITPSTIPLSDWPAIRIQVRREESGRLPQGSNPMRYPEFSTEYGHGIIMPTYGDGRQSLLSWFIRPDKLMIQVGVGQALRDTSKAPLLLDQAGLEKLIEQVASMIQLSETNTSPTRTTTTVIAPVSAEVQGYLDRLKSVWQAAGIPVLSLSTAYPNPQTESDVKTGVKPSDPLPYVALEVPESLFDSSDRLFTTENIMRQTMVAIRGGVPLHYLGIFQVAEDGAKQMYSAGEVYLLAMGSASEWNQRAKLSLQETTSRMRKIAEEAAKTAGVTLESFQLTEDASGRVVRIVGSVPDRATVLAPVKWFSAPPEDAAWQLNEKGAKISCLYVKVDDLKGAPVLRRIVGFSVGGGLQSRWVAPELEAVQPN